MLQPLTVARVRLRTWSIQQRAPPPCHAHRPNSAITNASLRVGVRMRVARPRAGRVYGLPKYTVLPQGTGVASNAEVRAAGNVLTPLVASSLEVEEDGRVSLSLLALGRARPGPLAKGWAIKAPVIRTRYTDEQKALLLECFNNPQRPNEANAHELFKFRFKDRDGKFARSLVMSPSKIIRRGMARRSSAGRRLRRCGGWLLRHRTRRMQMRQQALLQMGWGWRGLHRQADVGVVGVVGAVGEGVQLVGVVGGEREQ